MDLMPMYEALSQGQRDFFQSHPQYLRPEVAEAAREDFKRAANQGQAGLAYHAAMAAATIYLRLGDRPNALLNRFDTLQMLFMGANDPDEYDDVRQQILEVHEMARGIDDERIAFRSLVLAADTAWFAAQAAAGGTLEGLEPRLVGTLQDVLAALGGVEAAAQQPDERVWVERLASLLAAAVDAAMSTYWRTAQDDIDGLLPQLAAAADALPIDLTFEQEGPQKQASVAAVLEDLERRYR
jgi:hypothetical protein